MKSDDKSILEIPSLTGLRFIGAAWVAIFHLQDKIYEAIPFSAQFKPLLNQGYKGVFLFFILSGFIIWHNYGSAGFFANKRKVAKFFWRRIARLWPVNVLTLILAIPILYISVNKYNNWGVSVPPWYSVSGWLQNLTMLAQLANSQVVYQWNQPAWSLSGEMFVYLLFPIATLLLMPLLLVKINLKIVYSLICIGLLCLSWNDALKDAPYAWLINLSLTFLSGIMLKLSAPSNLRLINFIASLQPLFLCLVILACYLNTPRLLDINLVLLVMSLSYSKGPVSLLLRTRIFSILGQSSYSLYMIHWVIFSYGSLALVEFKVTERIYLQIYVVLVIAATIFSSWVIWKFYEVPMRKVMNSLFERAWASK
jgi:peptidoglycan/LPS O-acetylase OafA/YrhL